MNVFVTGASGFIGSAVVAELLAAGHQVTGLARSDSSAAAVAKAGADVHRGSLNDLDSLRRAAEAADGVIHTAFIHEFDKYAESAEIDRRAIEAMGEALAGTNRSFVVTSAVPVLAAERAATEEDDTAADSARHSEKAALPLAERGVRVSTVRLPPSVHGEGDRAFVPALIEIARTKGVSAYPGDGANRWSAVHRLDVAPLFRLALENASAGARLHGVAEEGIPVRELAEHIGRRLDVPVVSVPMAEVPDHFGWIGPFFSADMPASSQQTRQRFNWQPTHPNLLEDLAQDHYFESKS